MYKISFEKEEKADILIIYIYSKAPLLFDNPKDEVDVSFSYDSSNEVARIEINAFFTKYFKKQDIKITLSQPETPSFIIEYDSEEDVLSFYYEKTADYTKFNSEHGYYLYEIGDETIVQIIINNFSKYLYDKEAHKELFTKKVLINQEEKETITHYIEVLKRCEENFKEEKQEKLRKAKAYLQHIDENFPLTFEACIEGVEEQLKDFQFLELEECVINLKEMQRKSIRLEFPFHPFSERWPMVA